MSLGILADDGKIAWDTPVKTYLPTFSLEDPFATDRMTPKDLVTHRSGLPRHDLVWYNAPLSRKEIFDRLQFLEPNVDFRSKFQYQNLMFLTAGYLAGEVSASAGRSWSAESVHSPRHEEQQLLGREVKATADFALPYNEKDKAVQEIAFRNLDVVGPAGSINSNLADMAQWVKLHLSDGRVLGTRVISEAGLDEMHRPQMVLRDSARIPRSSWGPTGWAGSSSLPRQAARPPRRQHRRVLGHGHVPSGPERRRRRPREQGRLASPGDPLPRGHRPDARPRADRLERAHQGPRRRGREGRGQGEGNARGIRSRRRGRARRIPSRNTSGTTRIRPTGH